MAGVTAGAGCRAPEASFRACGDAVAGNPCGADPYAAAATSIDYPTVTQCSADDCRVGLDSTAPRTLLDLEAPNYRDIRLDEVIQQGLANSTVLHDLGGAILRSPDNAPTTWDPALRDTDPATGVEAALSAFDAQWTTSLFAENNDRAINNEFFGGGTRLLQQNAGTFQSQLAKRSVVGSELALRHIVEFDGNNAPGNAFPNAYTTKVEGEIRQPLLQGYGMQYNRIAGPTQIPGVYNGVLLARLNTDVQLTDFEMSVRDFVSNLENAYWDLYFAYRDLDAKIAARDSALDTWRRVRALFDAGRRGGEAEKEAQAREQYFRFKEEVENALSGRLFDGTRTGNGTLAGTFRGEGGVLVAERRLRRLMGLTASDGQLLRPTVDPVVAQVTFDWAQISQEAVDRRAELRRQRWRIRRRELELIASKNHLLPRLDAVGRYRFRGFGRDLLDSNGTPIPRFENAYEDLATGDFQEWQVGAELDIPIGYRRAHAGVRNAELRLARERALLCDQQLEIIHDVSNAVADVDRAFVVSQTSYNRLIATQEQVAAVKAAFESDKAPLDLLLESQRRLAEAESRYYRSLAEYAIAIKNVHFTKGTLLEYDGVFLAEGPWCEKAYHDAAALEARRGAPRPLNYASSCAPVVSAGEMAQQSHPTLIERAPVVMESAQPVEVSPLTQPDLTPPNAEVVPAPLQRPQ
jgi:outer membrane protein TolC